MPADHAIFDEPYPFQPSGAEQHSVACAAATALPNVPARTTYAVVQAAVAAIRYTMDGVTTPTSSVGFTLAAGASLPISGAAAIANFRAIAATAGALMDIGYYL